MTRLSNAEKLRRYRERIKAARKRMLETTFITPKVMVTASGVPYYTNDHGVNLPYYTIQREISDGVPD